LANGIVSFYFGGKAKLLAAALDDLIQRYDAVLARHLKQAGDRPQAGSRDDRRRLRSEALDPTRIAAWVRFLGDRDGAQPASRFRPRAAERKYTRMAVVELSAAGARRPTGSPVVPRRREPASCADGRFWWALMTDRKSFIAITRAAPATPTFARSIRVIAGGHRSARSSSARWTGVLQLVFRLERYEPPQALADGRTWHGFRPSGGSSRALVTSIWRPMPAITSSTPSSA